MKKVLSWLLILVLFVTVLPALPAGAETGDIDMLVLPDEMKRIGNKAFAGNTSLKTVIVPNTVTSIGSKAFANCTGIEEVVLASRTISIAEDAFEGCGDIIFSAHNGSDAELFALSNGYRCESLDDGSEYLARFDEMMSHRGFNPGVLMDDTFDSKCLIVRTDGTNRLPDISAYNPIDIFRSENNLFYIQFTNEDDTENCWTFLSSDSTVMWAVPDQIATNNEVSGQSVTKESNWGTSDVMGFNVYSQFVADHDPRSKVTVAVVDSGADVGSWAGIYSAKSRSYVGGNASGSHGSKIASIISDCLGVNVGRCELLSVKVMNSGSEYRTTTIIEGLKYAIDNGANVINLSIGMDNTNPEIAYQISRAVGKGIQVVVAAGNGSGPVMFPANCSGALAVSALTYNSTTGYGVKSRTGSEIDYTAPGHYLRTAAYPTVNEGDILGSASTSFATPQIVAALTLIRLDSTKSDPIGTLNSCCEMPGTLGSSAVGHGLPRLDRLAAINVIDFTLENMDGGDIPASMWAGESFMLTWSVVPENATEKAAIIDASDPKVLTVKNFGSSAMVTAKGVGTSTLTVTIGNISKQISLSVRQPVTNIEIIGAPKEIYAGKTAQMSLAITPANAENKAVIWSSSDESIAAISQNGLLTAKKVGKVRITCEAQDGYGTTATVDVTVLDIPDPVEITLTAKEKDISSQIVELEVGNILTLTAHIKPDEAIQEAQYTVFPSGIVTVTSDGILTAVAPGSAFLTAKATANNLVATQLAVTVVVKPKTLTVTADKDVLNIGETTNVYGTVSPANATDKSVTWKSQNPTVASVNDRGVVTALSSGTAIITGTTSNGIQDAISITVRKPITITFNPGEGSCSESKRTAYVGSPVGTLPTPVRQYYTFTGWYTTGGTKITDASVLNADTVLYARWLGNEYNITFDANGGTCSETKRTARVGSAIGTLLTPTRDYYTFDGWYTAKEGGTQIISTYVQNNTAELKLYAHWVKDLFTMKFNANGGTCNPTSKNYPVDTKVGPLPTPTKDYSDFLGWFTSATGGTQITADYEQSTTATITVYAHWAWKPYTMTFNATENGGSGSTSKTFYVNTAVGTLPTATKAYYDFKGWYTAASGGTQITASYIQSTDANITVYAQFSPYPYTMTFNATANGGSGSTSKTYYVDTAVGTLPTATKAYYDFKGWYTTADGNTQVTASYTQSTDANITVYAQFTPLPFFMTFNVVASDAFCNESTRTCYVDTPIGPLPVPTRPYYSFDGWYTAASGGTKVTATTYSTNANVMLYAHWTPNTFNITFNLNTTDAASCDITSMTGTVGVALSALPTPCRTFYRFIGWNTMSNGNGTMIAAGNQIQSAEPLTLYAQWTEVNHDEYLNQYGFTYVTREPVVYTVNAGGADIMRYPYSTGVVKLGHDDAGQKEVTAAIVRNNNGELWLINPSGTAFVKLSQVTFYETVEATFTVTDGQIPEGQIRQSTPFLVKGIIASDADMTRVTAGVYQNGACVSNGGSPISCNLNQGTSFSLAATDIGKELDFYHLAPGDYEFKVDIEYGSHNQSKTVVQTAFTITAYTGATSFKIYDFDYLRYMLNDNIENGWAVIGKVASDVNITNISILVKRADGTTITGPITAAPNTKGYDLNKLDGKVLFSKCTANKKHAYIVTAKDAAGRTLELFVVMEGRSSSAGGAKWVRDYVKVYTEPTLVKQWHNDDKIYMCFNSNVNWDTAKSYASSIGGQLACITSAEENAFIAANMPTAAQCYLIGGYKSGSAFVWCSGESMSYTNYNTGEPNNWCGVENYLAIRSADGKWCDEHSGYSEQLGGFIVEIPCSSY